MRDEPPVLEGLPQELSGIIARCLRKEPGERFSDANALLRELRASRAAWDEA